jgi:hypothetical protein
LILATPVDKYLPKLEFPRLLSANYSPDIVLTFQKLLGVGHPSSLIPIFGLPFVLLVLGKLKMLSKSPNPFRTLPTNLCVHKQFEMD